METAAYATLTRQVGLMREMGVIANNVANAATAGYRQEGLSYTEHVRRLGDGAAVSMAHARARHASSEQGALQATGAPFDLAIEGDGFFQVETPAGPRLTRAGSFTPNAAGELVSPAGDRLLGEGGAPVFVPPDAGDVRIGADGTISADGQPLGRIGLVLPADPLALRREDGVRFDSPGGTVPADAATMRQGYIEASNVDSVGQIARMIEVQRAYELGARFLETEDERVRSALKSLTR